MHTALISTDEERLACFEVLRELRPRLERDRFLEDLRRLGNGGYQLAAVWHEGSVRGVAGFRFLEMFHSGTQLYVDDLVTAAADRSHGYGAALLTFLEQHAKANGCVVLKLDSAHHRKDAHRFYKRQGMEDVSLHFSKTL